MKQNLRHHRPMSPIWALLFLTLPATAIDVGAQSLIQVTPTPVGVVNEIDFDLLQRGATDVASINSIAAPNATNIADIILTPPDIPAGSFPQLTPPGSYTVGTGLGRALALQNGGLALIDPPRGPMRAGRYDAFQAKILLGGLSSEIGIGIGDYIAGVGFEFFRGGFSLGTAFTTYTTPDIQYFSAPQNLLFDEVHILNGGGGNFVLSGLAIGPTFAPPEPALLSEGFVDGTPSTEARPLEFLDGATLTWQIRDRRDLLVGAPAIFFLNLGTGLVEPPIGASTPFLPSEFIQTTALSSPTGPTLSFPAVIVGGSAGAAPVQSLHVPPGLFPSDTTARLQALVLDPTVPGNFPVRTSNPIRFEFRSPAIVVSAQGADSGDSTDGFWKVEHDDPSLPAITRVVFDGTAFGVAFDTDQTGMAGLFEGGNSLLPSCAGTYRNGSDVQTGLVYDPLNTVPATPCDPNANTGWIGTNETTTGTFHTLEFRFDSFTAGTTFAFDADTDNFLANTGGAMAGVVITVELSDGTVLSGSLVADPQIASPLNALRSEVRF